MSDRKCSDAVSGLLDYDDGPFFEDARAVRENGRQAVQHMRCPRVVEPDDDDTHLPTTREGRDLTKVEIEGENDPTFRYRLVKDFAVRQPLKTLVAKMKSVVPLPAQPGGHRNIVRWEGGHRRRQGARTSLVVGGTRIRCPSGCP